MWLLFDMLHPRILGASAESGKLRYDEDEWPASLAGVRVTRVESIEDPLFLGVQKQWTELNLRRLYTWLKLEPAFGPAKMSEDTLLSIRLQIRHAIATQLDLEPAKLPALEVYAGPVSAPPKSTPSPPRLPAAQKGSVGPLIHRVATEMWEAAGSPRDIPTILQLRQTIMKTLNEEHKIKISTSSNELGRWQKQLLAS